MYLQVAQSRRKSVIPELASIFKATAVRHADRLALANTDGQGLSYTELDRVSEILAGKLRVEGLDRGEIAGLLGERSMETFVLMLAIQKAGAVYMPLDASLPEGRRRGMEMEARCRMVVDVRKWSVSDDLPSCRISENSHTRCPEPANIATLIFTSGSTGRPKGALNTHASLGNLAKSCAQAWELKSSDRCLQFVSIGFDVSLEEVWSAWSVGAAVVILPETARHSFDELSVVLEKEKVTVMHLPAAFWNNLTSELSAGRTELPHSLRLMVIGGEIANPVIYKKWREASGGTVRLANEYGLSETAVTSTIYRDWVDGAPDERGISIGRPISGVEIRIIRDNGETAAPGETGEIVIGGRGVGAGYLNLPEETRQRFVKTDDGTVFRTGDIGYLDSDGLLFFKGRHDRQVKINGHRIELGEIETHLHRVSGVRECVTRLENRKNGVRCIHAYVAGDSSLDPKSIQTQLADVLTQAMVPASISILDELPKTINGKIDLAQLVIPEAAATTGATTTHESFAARVVLSSAQSTLGTAITLDSSFTDLGGDSLTATEMSTNLAAYGFHLEAHQILMAPSLRDLASDVTEGSSDEECIVLLARNNKGTTPVSVFHATPGDLLGYRHLALMLGKNRPCYGILSTDLRKESGFHESIESMASCYADQLIASEIPEPYHLAGWCFGGLLAFETAIQLRERGCEVGYIGLIETPSPGILASRWLRARLRVRSMLKRGPGAILRTFLNILQKKREQEVAGGEAEMASAPNEALYRSNLSAVSNYPKKIYPGSVDLFFSADECVSEEDDLFGWCPSPCAMHFDYQVVPGDHTGMLMSPGADLIAAAIEQGICDWEAANRS